MAGTVKKITIKLTLVSLFLVASIFMPWRTGAGLDAESVFVAAYASSQQGGHGDAKAKHGDGDGHGGGHGAHPAPPIKYYIHWIILLAALILVVRYLREKFKDTGHVDEHQAAHADAHEDSGGHGDDDEEGGHHGIHVVQEAKKLSFILCCFVIFLFFIEYAPSLAGYHESVPVAAFKFAVKMVLGIGMTAFGIMGMDEH